MSAKEKIHLMPLKIFCPSVGTPGTNMSHRVWRVTGCGNGVRLLMSLNHREVWRHSDGSSDHFEVRWAERSSAGWENSTLAHRGGLCVISAAKEENIHFIIKLNSSLCRKFVKQVNSNKNCHPTGVFSKQGEATALRFHTRLHQVEVHAMSRCFS